MRSYVKKNAYVKHISYASKENATNTTHTTASYADKSPVYIITYTNAPAACNTSVLYTSRGIAPISNSEEKPKTH